MGSFNPFQGIQVLSDKSRECHTFQAYAEFQSLSGNSSVVGCNCYILCSVPVNVSIPFREFKCCREYECSAESDIIRTEFQSLSGNSSVVGWHWKSFRRSMAGFNPFQGIQVLSVIWKSRRRFLPAFWRFNPFQGIQVLSAGGYEVWKFQSHDVSIPFREFKCCRGLEGAVAFCFGLFQSLSGNSSVVGEKESGTEWLHVLCVSIPFREFKCCRLTLMGIRIPKYRSFNPFQGIQVLSVTIIRKDCVNEWIVSIPFREFKCCRHE